MVEHGVNNDHIIGLKGNYRFKSGFFKKLFCKNADIVTWPLEYERRIFQVRKTDLIGRCQRMSRRKGTGTQRPVNASSARFASIL